MINYNYELPKASGNGDNLVSRLVLDGWQISGHHDHAEPARAPASPTRSPARPTNDLSGNGGHRRVTLVCDPNLPSSERTFDRQFKTECIKPGGGPNDPYYLGTSTNDEYNPPGYINHDITFFKNFAMGTRSLQFRAELYNAFNTTQYQALNGRRVRLRTPARRRTPISAASPVSGRSTNRIIQLGVRFTF